MSPPDDLVAQNTPLSQREAPCEALDVICLCAEWCPTCREYREVFAQLATTLPGHRYRWIDIEDEAALVGDIDVETFPTLVLGRSGQLLFAGPVLPRQADARRLVQAHERALALALPELAPGQARAYEALLAALSSALRAAGPASG